jgi:hypothetical protein
MGEYVKLDGETVKLGTCEDLTDFTFDQFTSLLTKGRLQQEPGNEKPIEYIKGGYRFRFPFPNEDGDSLGSARRADLDRGLLLSVPKSLDLGFSEHKEICHPVKIKGGGGLNVFLPCPASKDWAGAKVRTSVGPHSFTTHDDICIVQQRPLDGQLWAVVECAYCGVAARIAEAEAQRLVGFIKEKHDVCNLPSHELDNKSLHDFWVEIADRIARGYAPDNSVQELIALGWLPQVEKKEVLS